MARGRLCITTTVSADGLEDYAGVSAVELRDSLILEHQPIPFPSYPYEWAPEMLQAAGELTLELAEKSLEYGYLLKDATPFNVLFDEHAAPVFIDFLSFGDRALRDPIWRAHAEFLRTFVYPLWVNRLAGIGLDQIFITRRDGLEPEDVRRLLPWWRLALPPLLGSVLLPSMLSSRAGTGNVYRQREAGTPDEAIWILRRLLRKTGQLLRWGSRTQRGGWSSYMSEGHRYSVQELGTKQNALVAALDRFHPTAVLDIGCNTGYFSLMVASRGASVVAIDRDAAAVGSLWRQARDGNLSILPLVVDIARPSPALGWTNGECASFLDRARGRFDCVLMLALLHHLMVAERVPLDMIFTLAASLTTSLLIVEYVDPADEQFRRIARGRDHLHADLSAQTFEEAALRHFEIVSSVQVTPTRTLYTLRKRSTDAA